MNKKYVLVMALLLAVSLPAFSVTLEQGTQILSEIDEIANFEGTDFSA